jgi:serine/threonine-protein kinase
VYAAATLVNDELSDVITIGPYRLLSTLGKGGMAEVFMAEHRHLGQIRAVKVLLPEVSQRPGFVGRLLTEARATARLQHPAIVEVFDCDTLPEGGAFIAMEYLRGEPAGDWLARIGDLSPHPRLAAAFMAVVADGLSFAHAEGIVHRDLKPHNLFLLPDPDDALRFSVKILDFGVAKILRGHPLTKTREGAVVGTPLYMSPEQWRPEGVIDHRADVYALGCVFFELLAGRPPFEHDDAWEIMQAHLNKPAPRIRGRAPAVPPQLDELLARMLAKAPEERPQSMAEVVAALEGFLGARGAEVRGLLRAPVGFPIASGQATPSEPTKPGVGSTSPHLVPTEKVRPGAGAGAPLWTGRRRTQALLVGAVLLGAAAVTGLLVGRGDRGSGTATTAPAPPAAPLAPAPTPAAAAPAPTPAAAAPAPMPAAAAPAPAPAVSGPAAPAETPAAAVAPARASAPPARPASRRSPKPQVRRPEDRRGGRPGNVYRPVGD